MSEPFLGENTILFGGSGFLGPYILNRCPQMVSVGRTRPAAPNAHVPIASLADLDVLDRVAFDKVVYIIGHTNHHALEQEEVPRGEPNAFDYHLTPLLQTLEQLKRRPIRKFIHFSTILLYDDRKLTIPVSEASPIDPYKNRYVLSKYLAEEASKFYEKWMPILTVRFSNLYGPTPLERYDLIHVLVRRLLAEGRAEIWSRRPERDFIYVEDAAEAIVQLLESDAAGLLNLGSGSMTSVARIADLLSEISGCPIVDRDIPVPGPMQFQCDLTRLRSFIDWTPRHSIEEGVRRTFEETKTRRA